MMMMPDLTPKEKKLPVLELSRISRNICFEEFDRME